MISLMVFNKFLKISTVFLVIFIFCLLASEVWAAELYLNKSAGSVYAKDDVLAEIRLNTEGEFVNAGEVGVIFDKNVLQAVDVSDGGSAFNIFATRPKISEEKGKIFFSGGSTIPFSGDVLLARVMFKAKDAGVAQINFSPDSRVILGDGMGTVAKLSLRGLELQIQKDKPLGLPVIYSSSHPDQARFYNNNQAVIQWDREIGYRYSYVLVRGDREEPDDIAEKEINSTLFTELEDGIYWFGIKAINRRGEAGPTAFFRLMVDTTPPEDLEASVNKDNSGRLLVALTSTDKMSGIDYYNIETPEGVFEQKESNLVSVGNFSAITVRVFDKAGNVLEKQVALGGGEGVSFWLQVLAGVLVLIFIFYVFMRRLFDKPSLRAVP